MSNRANTETKPSSGNLVAWLKEKIAPKNSSNEENYNYNQYIPQNNHEESFVIRNYLENSKLLVYNEWRAI